MEIFGNFNLLKVDNQKTTFEEKNILRIRQVRVRKNFPVEIMNIRSLSEITKTNFSLTVF